jgi:hypothetical protein
MVAYIEESGWEEKDMVKEYRPGKKEMPTKVNGR